MRAVEEATKQAREELNTLRECLDQTKFNNQIEREFNNWNVQDQYKDKTVEELNALQPKLGYAVAAYNVEKGLNIGTMLRTAVCFGANEFIIFGNSKWDKRSTVGAQNYIKVTKISQECLLTKLQIMGYFPVFIEQGEYTIHEEYFWDYLASKEQSTKLKPCFIFGGEAEGIPKRLTAGEPTFRIVQHGVLRSLNVASACSIVLNTFINEM